MKKKSIILFLVIILFSVFAVAAERLCFEEELPRYKASWVTYVTEKGTYSYDLPSDATRIELHNFYYWRKKTIGPSKFSIDDGGWINFFNKKAGCGSDGICIAEGCLTADPDCPSDGYVCEKVSTHGRKCMYPYGAENLGGSTVTVDTGRTRYEDHALIWQIVLKAYCEVAVSPQLPQCSDSLDNDGDGLIDMNDPGCVSLFDDDESDMLCSSSSQTIFRISDVINAHAEVFDGAGNYPVEVCYDEIFGLDGNGVRGCTGSNTILKLSDTTNAHVSKASESGYDVNVCYGNLECDYATNCQSLGQEYKCLASISDVANAHAGNCVAYENKICCKVGEAGEVILLPPCGRGTSLCADGTCKEICSEIPCDDGTDGFCVVGCTPIDPDCDSGTCDRGDGCGGGTCTIPDPDCDGATCNPGDMCLVDCDPVDPDCECDPLDTDCVPPTCDPGDVCVVGCDPVDPDCGGCNPLTPLGQDCCNPGNGCAGGSCTIPDPDCDGATCREGDGCLADCPTPDLDCFYSCNGDDICDSNEGCDCDACFGEQNSCGLDNGEQLYCVNDLCGSLPCRFDSIEWRDLCANEGQGVGAILYANSGCFDKQVNFSVSEIDPLSNDPAKTNPDPSDVILSEDLGTGYVAFAVWTAEHSDLTYPSEYSIEAILDEEDTVRVVSGSDELLEVQADDDPCAGCSLSVTIGSGQSCVNSVCWEGDEIKVNANYNGQDCPLGDTFLQVDLEDDDMGLCSFQLNTTCTSSGNCESVELDYELIEEVESCFGATIIGIEAGLYEDYMYSNLIKPSDIVGGSFEFGSGAYDCEMDIGGLCLLESQVETGLDCAVTIPTTGCDDITDASGNPAKCYTDCGEGSCGDAGGQWCSLTGYGDFYGDEEFSDYISGSGCWNDCVLKNCGNAWSVGVWSECSKDGIKERDVFGYLGDPNTPNWEGGGFDSVANYYQYCGDYKPNSEIECIIEAPFPFFSWFNILLSILILISYYFWKERK